VEIKDPCKRAIMQAAVPSPLQDMTLIRYFDTQKIQAISVSSDVEASPGISCSKVFTLVAPLPFVTIVGSSLIVNAELTTATDVGTHVVQVKADSLDYPADVADVTYSFTLVVQHCVVNTFTINSIPDQSYVVNAPSLSFNFDFGVWSNLACTYNVAHTPTYKKNGVSIAPPGWIVFSPLSKSFSVSTNSLANVGDYEITVTATIP